MSLFQFELKKLLLNKKTLIMLAAMTAFYMMIGILTSNLSMGNKEYYETYANLAESVVGEFNPQQGAESTAIYEAAMDRYGNSEAVIDAGDEDAALKFHIDYAGFTSSVDAYYDDLNKLQAKLDAMDQNGNTSSFEYKKTATQLEMETALAAPVFANTTLWGALFDNWGSIWLIFMIFIPLAYIIAPIFSMEASTGMDNFILSSKHGRKKIVTAKLLTAVITSAVVALLYLTAIFFANFLALGSFVGADAALRSVASFVSSPLGISVWQFALIAIAWISLMSIVFGIIMTFVSSTADSQMGAFGVGVAILIGFVSLSFLEPSVSATIWPLIDFGPMGMFLVSNVFADFKVYNVFGLCIPYYAVALAFVVALCGMGIWAAHHFQKKRTVA